MLNPTQIQEASRAVRGLRVALSNFFLYAAGNNMALLSIQSFLGGLEELFRSFPSVTLGESEGRLVMEATPLDEHTTGSTHMLLDLFLSHKIHSLTFLKGVGTDEIKELFSLLRPRALPTGLSLSQALLQHSLEHIRANEKIFVAVAEGERVVSADALPKGEQNLQESLEALQYFLQIFARLKPDANKQEVARKMMDHMGSWVSAEGMNPEPGTPKEAAPAESKAWTEVLGGFLALKNNLAAAPPAEGSATGKANLEELLRKLVALGEAQGVKWEEGKGANAGLSPESPRVLEANRVLAAVKGGSLDVFWDSEREEMADQCVSRLQDPDQLENFESLWAGLWEKMFSEDEKTQALCLRHLNRLQWNQLPRALQMEGFRNLRRFLSETHRPAVYPIGLTLAQDWIPLELARPDWEELLETVRLLRQLSEKKPPFFERQNLAAKVALETVFCEPILESLLRRYKTKTPDGEGIQKLFVLLGQRAAPLLFEKIEQEAVENPEWKKAAELLNALQAGGQHIYEFWLEWPEKKEHLEKFLEIFRVTALSGEMEDYFERHWTSFHPAAQLKILDIVEHWKSGSFRPFLLRLLEKPDNPVTLRALQVLGKIGLEGDATAILQAVQKYPPHAKEREAFWIKACQTLGEMADPSCLETLMEWGDKYKLMENKKNRSQEIRRAALEALGRFPTPQVVEFLTRLQKDGEKELRPVIDQALASAGEKTKK
jgi:hypothetical protein